MKNRIKYSPYNKEKGFGLVEVLVVVIILGLLAAIAIPIYMQQQRAAHDAASKQSLSYLQKAVTAAKTKTGKSLIQITVTQCTLCSVTPTGGPDPLTLPKTDASWLFYYRTLDRISEASGMNVTNLVDGYGRPLVIDENEGEGGNCNRDLIGVSTDPYAGRAMSMQTSIPNTTQACQI